MRPSSSAMANAVFSCAKCGRAIGDIPPSGRLVVVCAHCRLKYEVIHGRVLDVQTQRVVLRPAGYRDPGRYGQGTDLRVHLPNGRTELVTYQLPEGDSPLAVGIGDVIYAIYLMRGSRREQLLTVHNGMTGQTLSVSLPGDRSAPKAWWFSGIATATGLVLLSAIGLPGVAVIAVGAAMFVGLGIGLGYRFMPHAEISADEMEQLTAAQLLLAEKLNVEAARSRTIREFDARREFRDRLSALRAKMQTVGLELYQPRIAAIDRALALTDSQLDLIARLRDGYERSIQMLEIEIEAGAAADALDASASSHIAATLAEMRDLEEQQADLTRQLSANVEVERLLKSSTP